MWDTKETVLMIDEGFFEMIKRYCYGNTVVDYGKLALELCDQRRPFRKYLFYAKPYMDNPPTRKQQDSFNGKMAFLKSVERNHGYEIISGKVVKNPSRPSGFEQKGVDTEIATMIQEMVNHDIRRFVFVFGDGDFLPAVRRAKVAGAWVRLCYENCNDDNGQPRTRVDRELIDESDDVLKIDHALISRVKMK